MKKMSDITGCLWRRRRASRCSSLPRRSIMAASACTFSSRGRGYRLRARLVAARAMASVEDENVLRQDCYWAGGDVAVEIGAPGILAQRNHIARSRRPRQPCRRRPNARHRRLCCDGCWGECAGGRAAADQLLHTRGPTLPVEKSRMRGSSKARQGTGSCRPAEGQRFRSRRAACKDRQGPGKAPGAAGLLRQQQ